MTLMHDRESDPRIAARYELDWSSTGAPHALGNIKRIQHSEDREEPFETHAKRIMFNKQG